MINFILKNLSFLALSCGLMTLVWGLVIRYKIPSIIDAYWSLGIALLGSLYLATNPTTLSIFPTLMLLLLWIWALRLGGYLLLTRVRSKHQDPRYSALAEKWASLKWGYFKNMQIQAGLQWAVASVFIFPNHRQAETIGLSSIGVIISILGLMLEWSADYQLHKFKKKRKAQEICNSGLWALSRHPNYVGEWIFWIGMSLISWGTFFNSFAWLSPTVMYIILVHITGPLTEKASLRSKPELYAAYQKVTPYFLPRLSDLVRRLKPK